jgi:hypothetical protein
MKPMYLLSSLKGRRLWKIARTTLLIALSTDNDSSSQPNSNRKKQVCMTESMTASRALLVCFLPTSGITAKETLEEMSP